MKKTWITISSIIGALIVAVVLFYIFIATIFGSILTSSFGTKTTVNHAALTFRKLALWSLKIHNPPKTKDPYALKVGKIQINAPITTYLSNDIIIDSIRIKDLTLVVESMNEGRSTNWDPIISHINKSDKGENGGKKDATVKLLTIDNIIIKVTDKNGKTTTSRIKNLTFRDLSTKNGDITAQIAQAVLLKLIFNVDNLIKLPLKITNQQLDKVFKFGGRSASEGGSVKVRFGKGN